MLKRLFQDYNEFHVDEIQTNRFSPEKFNQVLDTLLDNEAISTLGESVEGRPIRMISIGTGPTKVLIWSQMHGNESTATRAILDILKFNHAPGMFLEEWQSVLSNLTIYIIPMVNPDGTASFQRRNALGVDLNRDARAFETPEAQLLRDVMISIKPDFSFNLHDQRRFYNVTGSGKPSTVSFLAPAFNSDETVNETRLVAMQLIALLHDQLEEVIPGQVGLYDDSFAPRAFGDYSQATGSATILVEAGWQQYDMEKEYVRQLNFALIISGLHSIATGTYQNFGEKDYREIPMNDEKLFDVLIRGVQVVKERQQVRVDLGLQREEVTIAGSGKYYSKGIVADIGDLKEWYGFEEVKAGELLLTAGKVLTMSLANWQDLDEADKVSKIKEGYLFLQSNDLSNIDLDSGELINLLGDDKSLPVEFEKPANFLLINKTGDIKYIILNGFLWPIDEAPPEGLNGLILA